MLKWGKFVHNIKYVVWVLLLFLSLDVVHAAIISGSIYDIGLQKESNIIVEVNTTPKQMLVSKSGDYSFNVKPGTYKLYAHTNISEANESIQIMDDGNYTLDIILEEKLIDVLGDISLKDSDIVVSSSDIQDSKSSVFGISGILGTVLIVVAIILIVVAVIALIVIRSKRHIHVKREVITADKPLDEYENSILSIIKREKRTTQKDLRKEIPLSEAKISLVLSDLEHQGKIRKIKKGRGNILIFVKD